MFLLYNNNPKPFPGRAQLGDLSNPELRMLTDQLERIRFGGDEAPVRRLSVRGLLPDTEHYMTYEGSTTSPACPETVTWVVQNKPIYITKQQVKKVLRGFEVFIQKKCHSLLALFSSLLKAFVQMCTQKKGQCYF